jgi:hypothetical protein
VGKNEWRRIVVAFADLTGSQRALAAPASEVLMELRSVDQSTGNPRAGDNSPESSDRRLRATLLAIFQDAALHKADIADAPRPDLRVELRRVCEDARRSGLRAEQLLVLIKDVWSTLPAAASRAPTVHGDERLNYVISTCVDEYYAHLANDHGASS